MVRFVPRLNQLEARETPTSIPPVDPITPLPGPPPVSEPALPGPYTPEPAAPLPAPTVPPPQPIIRKS